MASPASFNNLMGLSRAINDKLTPGTEVFVAEMGMNAEGRIRELCQSFPPYIAAITVVGEAHYERLGSHEAILRAKSEITENASVVVLPIDQPELVRLAETCRNRGTIVVTVSALGQEADVSIDPDAGTLRYGPGTNPVSIDMPPLGHAINVAVALGIAWALDVPAEGALKALPGLPVAAHRSELTETGNGVAVIDDTYNSNPPGAARAIAGAAELAARRGGRFFVVTPGMVELGELQHRRNRELGEQVREAGGLLYAVGLTNRRALVEGGGPQTQVFLVRDDAVGAVNRVAGPSDVILYENDLPDHYP
jgi:UDP-N-acetylmuramoyl-tripeptide--D-alanyl-D-alanine ligase